MRPVDENWVIDCSYVKLELNALFLSLSEKTLDMVRYQQYACARNELSIASHLKNSSSPVKGHTFFLNLSQLHWRRLIQLQSREGEVTVASSSTSCLTCVFFSLSLSHLQLTSSVQQLSNWERERERERAGGRERASESPLGKWSLTIVKGREKSDRVMIKQLSHHGTIVKDCEAILVLLTLDHCLSFNLLALYCIGE